MPTQPEPRPEPIILTQHSNPHTQEFGVTVDQAPQLTEISLDLLLNIERRLVEIDPPFVAIGSGGVMYKIVGYNSDAVSLILERVS